MTNHDDADPWYGILLAGALSVPFWAALGVVFA
jgi:hypothetical protein